jgi:acyl-CoA thioester hydrolase
MTGATLGKNVGTIELRVRYAETDRMGVVHHAGYLIWFEAGRTDFMRERGISYRELEEKGVFLPVSESYCRIVGPSHYDDLISVETWIETVKSRQVSFAYRVLRQGTVLATGKTVHMCTDANSKLSVMPAWVKKALLRYAAGGNITHE